MPDAFDVYLRLPDQIWLNPPEDNEFKVGDIKPERMEITENGIYQKIKDTPFLYKGYAEPRIIRAVSAVKKALLRLAHFFYSHPYLIPLAWIFRKKMLFEFSRFSHRVLRDYYWIPQAYLPTSKEIFDELDIDFDIAMLIKMVWEFDDAYRYRGQFALMNLDRGMLLVSPRRELERVCDLMISREKSSSMRGMWMIAKMFVLFPPTRKRLVDYLLRLNLVKFEMDEVDRYFISLKRDKDFDYGVIQNWSIFQTSH